MEVWVVRITTLSVLLAAPLVARADPPAVTVMFGSPAARPRVIVVPVEAAPADPEPAVTAPSSARPAPTEPAVSAPSSSRSERTEPPSAPASTPIERIEPAVTAPSSTRTERIEPPVTSASTPPERREPAAAPTPRCPPAITIVRRIGGRTERVRMPLLECDGTPREEARLALGVLARARAVEAPPSEEVLREWRERDGDRELVAPGVRLLHPGLLERLQRIGEAFDPHPIEIVSGYRPDSPSRSRHHHARALDIVVQGTPREALRDLAVGFEQTGVGWYPNSVFVHVDVREESAYWVDLSGPGERPRYVRGAEPPAPAAPPEPSDSPRIEDALDAVRRGVRVALPADAHEAEDEPSDEDLARMRRETEAALRAIVVPPL